ncbi:restriction endonuclease subunit S [Alloscardovia omnicolens]|uniref:restriction endonuclease subunit S n=4 Tax=Alloscardovia omnicolens TaxID=419015 RepID=UPI00254C3332|nr:restriction endonuclease subunit S [Alloscardovia omnicolens]MDK6249421.1 restriction endonuclease subunit S [Alloscardovia omnicolens]
MREYRLGEIFNLQMGKTPSRNNLSYWGSKDNQWISIADLSKSGKYIEETKEYLSDRAVEESGISVIPANTVVMSFKLSIGKTAITPKSMYSNEAIMAFCDKKVTGLLPDYIYYMFLRRKWESGTNKAVMGNTLNKSTLSNIKVKIHKIDKQREIVKILDCASQIIDDREKQLHELDALVKARFVEMFGDVIINTKGWEVCSLEQISTSRLGKMLDVKQQTGMHRFPYLANYNVQWFHFDLTDLREMDFNEADQIEFDLQDGDLLITEGGEVGRCAIWHNEVTPCFFQKALHRVRVNRNVIIPEYLAYWFKSHADYNAFEDIVGGQSTIAHLPGVKLKQLQVVVPPMELQNDFAAFVAQVDKSKVAVQKALDEAQTLFDSLMQEYFG